MNIGQFALKGKTERDRCRKNIARRPIKKYGDILRFRIGRVNLCGGQKPYPRRMPLACPMSVPRVWGGSFSGVWLGGWMYDGTVRYDGLWWMGAALGGVAAILHWPISERPVERLATGKI